MTTKRWKFEACVLAYTTAHLILKARWSQSAGDGTQARWSYDVALFFLTALALVTESFWEGQPSKRHGYETKPADSEGVAVGALALPWLFHALSNYSHSYGPYDLCFKLSVIMVCCMLAWICMRSPIKRDSVKGSNRQTPGTSTLTGAWHQRQYSVVTGLICIIVLLWLCNDEEQRRKRLGRSVFNAMLYAASLLSFSLFHAILVWLPKCFTLGEAMVTVQALILLALDSVYLLFSKDLFRDLSSLEADQKVKTLLWERSASLVFAELLIMAVLSFAAFFCLTARSGRNSEQAQSGHNQQSKKSVQIRKQNYSNLSSLQIIVLAGLAIFGIILLVQPVLLVLRYVCGDRGCLSMLAYWGLSLGVVLPLMDWTSRKTHLQTILIRKGYHLLALALFAPALMLQPNLLVVGLAVACALLIVVEMLRISNIPVLAPKIHGFMTSFIDERDSGLLLVSHFSLLLGMATPVWLLVGSSTGKSPSIVPAFSGIIILGIADSAASALGRRYGVHKFLGTKKSLEGTFGGIVCNALAWGLVKLAVQEVSVSQTVFASVISCLLEASTTQLDNVFLPLHHLTLML